MSADPAALRVRRHGLRIATAVAVGFAWADAGGAVLPFLGPFFAIQLLLAPRPPGLGQALGLVVVVVGASVAMLLLTGALREQPPALVAVLALVYFVCFFLQAAQGGGGAPFLVLVVAIIVPMFGILQKDLGQSITVTLANGAIASLLLTWGAHAVFPDPGGLPPPSSPPRPGAGSVRRAAANAAILLIIVSYCLTNNAMSSAVVVPITVASLLGQLDLARRLVAVIGLMVVNLLGGLVASLAFTVYELWPAPVWLFLVVLVVALLFGGKAAADPAAARTYAGALSIFCILFGLGVSPLPASTPESFSTRVGLVLFAVLYTVTMAALVWRAADTAPTPAGRGEAVR